MSVYETRQRFALPAPLRPTGKRAARFFQIGGRFWVYVLEDTGP